MYNQLVRDKKTVDKNNSRLRQEKDEQKKSVLRMKRAFTYIEGKVAELQAKQHCEPTPQPSLSNQATPPPITLSLPLVTPLEPTSVRESKKIVVVPDPPIFSEDGKEKEKEVSYDH